MSPLDHQREPQLGARVLNKTVAPRRTHSARSWAIRKFINPDGDVLPFDDFLRSRWLAEGSVQLFSVEDES